MSMSGGLCTNMRYKTIALSLVLIPSAVFGGASLVLTPTVTPQNSSLIDPLLSNQSFRVEFQMHDWTLPAAGNFAARIFRLDGTGLIVFLYPNGLIALEGLRDSVDPAQPCFVDVTGRNNVLLRFQRDLAQQRVSCEVWNYDGTGYSGQFLRI